MSTVIRMAVILCFGVVAVVGVAGTAIAQDGMENRLRALEERLQQQDEEIQRLRGALAEQQEASESLETEMDRYLGKVEDAAWWQEPNTLRAYYKTGLNLETQDGKFHLKIGGRVMFDVAHFDYDGKEIEAYNPNPNDNAIEGEFRRVRFFMEGDVYGNVFYKVQIDFAGSSLSFKDVFLGISGIPFIGNFRVGNQKEPFGLEVLTSSKYITFIDRGLPTAFAPERNAGIQLYNSALDDRLFWAIGVFSEANGDHRMQAPVGNAFTARVVYLPYFENKGEQLAHIGIAYSYRGKDSFHSIGGLSPTHMANPLLAGLTVNDVKSQTLLGAELLAIWGQFSFQAEYMMMQADTDDDPRIWGWYAYLSFFVTGEHRSYKNGALGRITPLANFDMDGGMGAIEFAIRYAMVEYDDLKGEYPAPSGAKGGQSDITVAVNWYLNPNTRIMLNYMVAFLEGVDNQVTIILIRFQIDF